MAPKFWNRKRDANFVLGHACHIEFGFYGRCVSLAPLPAPPAACAFVPFISKPEGPFTPCNLYNTILLDYYVSVNLKRYHPGQPQGNFSETGQMPPSWESFWVKFPAHRQIRLEKSQGTGQIFQPLLLSNLIFSLDTGISEGIVLFTQWRGIIKEIKIHTAPNRTFIDYNFYLSNQFITRLRSLVMRSVSIK